MREQKKQFPAKNDQMIKECDGKNMAVFRSIFGGGQTGISYFPRQIENELFC